jgi:hypothetical protein
MSWLTTIITAVIQAILGWASGKARPTGEDGDSDARVRRTLRDKIRKQWIVVALLIPILAGCAGGAPFTRTVYVAHGTPVRLRETVKHVKVWVKDAKGELLVHTMDLPEGWYCLPLEADDKDGNK